MIETMRAMPLEEFGTAPPSGIATTDQAEPVRWQRVAAI